MQVGQAGEPEGSVRTPRPRVVQLTFAAVLLLDVALRLGADRLELRSWPVLAVAVVLIPTAVLTWVDPPQGHAGAAVTLVALGDLVLVGLATTDGGTAGSAALAALPAMWLAVRHGPRGTAWAAVSTLALVALAPRLLDPAAGGSLVDLLPVLLLVLVCAGVVGAFTSSTRSAALRHEDGTATLAAVLDTVDVGLAVLDLDGAMVAQNRHHAINIDHAHPDGFPGVADVPQHGYAEDGRTPLTWSDRPTVLAQRGHELDDYRIWVGADPDTRLALSVSSRTVRDSTGRRIGAVIATRDITSFMRSLQSRDEFISRASHELRTPLSSIFGYLHLLRARDDLSDAAQEDLESVVQSTERLARQVADLVHAARHEQPRIPLSRHEVGLVPFVSEVVDTLRVPASAAGVRLQLHVEGEGAALVDTDRVTELMSLLVDDAVGRTDGGGVVHVAVEAADGVGEISVVDDGPRQAEGPDPMPRCLEIVEAHGGRLETEEAPRGTVVRVRLRLAVPLDEPAAS